MNAADASGAPTGSRLPLPRDPALPLFVYGSLKPGELAHELIARFVCESRPATVAGVLRLRDGLPLLDPRRHGNVRGVLLSFVPARVGDALEAVAEFEPRKQYVWAPIDAVIETERLPANVLAGKNLDVGTAGDSLEEWSAAGDPVFAHGLDEVERLVQDAIGAHGLVSPERPAFWPQFFRLQAAYLLLWTVVERYTALRFGPGIDPWKRVVRLDSYESFTAAVRDSCAQPGIVVDSRNPKEEFRLQEDGSGAATYYYQVRSNLSHRGKGAYADAHLVLKTVTELHKVMRTLLAPYLGAGNANV